MKMNEDYVVTDNDVKYKDKDVVATLKILKGPFEGVEFHFGEINVTEDEANGHCYLSFNYDIISDHQHLEKTEDFENTLEVIMNDVLLESLKSAEEKYNNELREKNTEASDS
jgi:hypothetical protein